MSRDFQVKIPTRNELIVMRHYQIETGEKERKKEDGIFGNATCQLLRLIPEWRVEQGKECFSLSDKVMKKKRKKSLSLQDQQCLEQARKIGYLLCTADLPQHVRDRYRSLCNQLWQMTIEVEPEHATIRVNLRAVLSRWKKAGMVAQSELTVDGQSEVCRLIERALRRSSSSKAATYQVDKKNMVISQINVLDVDQIVSDLTRWWSRINKEYERAERREREELVAPRRQVPVKPPEPEAPWKVALRRVEEQGAADLPSCMNVPLPEQLSSLLSKEQIGAFLGHPPSRKETKAALFAELVSLLEQDVQARARFFEIFSEELEVPPWELEQLLNCTTTERKRWVTDGRLVPSAWRTVEKSGRTLTYPVFERRYVASFTEARLAHFRAEHEALVTMRRKTGAKRAVESRSENAEARKLALQEAEELFGEWARLDFPELAAVLRLSFWTVWASRWAKENILLSRRAVKHSLLYQERKAEWYQKKDEALAVLAHSCYAHLTYYRPEEPDKIELQLCDDHYSAMREGYYDGKWDFYHFHQAEISHCAQCIVSVQREYYSLYAIEITAPVCPDIRFSFHVPYPIGKAFLPAKEVLPGVIHMEQEDGLFRFGRSLYANEKVLYREKDVATHLEQALDEARKMLRLGTGL